MMPAGFPFASIIGEGLSVGFPLTQASLNNLFLGSNPSGLSPAQLLQHAILQNTLNPLAPVLYSGNVPNANQVGILPGHVQLTSPNPMNCVNPLMIYPSAGAIQVPLSSTTGPSQADVDAHTIVRGPVLYKKNPVATDGDDVQTGSNNSELKSNKETSPPDRIVASYAAAAHAAALANHQPVSKAAEVFLAATTTGRTRHPKRSRPHGSAAALSDVTAKRVAACSSNLVHGVVQPVSGTATMPSTDLTADNSLTEWRRIVDRISGKVVYISPDGISLNNKAEVYAYFRTRFPSFADDKNCEQLIASSFVFEPTTEAPSLETSLDFITALQPTTCCSVTTALSNPVTLASANTSGSQTRSSSDGSPKSSNASVCRIAFNPNRVRNDGTNPLGRLSSSDLSSDTMTSTTTVPPSESAEVERSKVTSPIGTSLSSGLPPDVPGDPTCVSQAAVHTQPTKSDHCDAGVNSATDNVSSHNQHLPSSDKGASTTERIFDTNSTGIDTVDNVLMDAVGVNTAVTSAKEAPATTPGFVGNTTSNPRYTPATTAETTVARMTTETLTTGILNTAIPSCSSTLVPSVVPPVSSNDLGLLALAGLVSEPSVMYSVGGNGDNVNGDLNLSSLLANSRLVQQQQQQLTALISALSAGSGQPQSYSAPALIASNNQLNPLILATHQPYASSWPQVTSIPGSWSDLSNSSTLSTLQQQQQQQLLAAAALQQQQQARANWAAQVVAMLQRQQALANQQQQQQQALASAGQMQAYLAALQRHFSIG